MRHISPLISVLVPVIAVGFLVGCSSSEKGVSENFELNISSLSGETDTVTFHIGSPLFLRVTGEPGRGCEPMNGRFFIFSERDMQLNWGFREVVDSVVLPREIGDCGRYLMLSSEESNALAEGHYKVSVALLLDERSKRASDTIVLNPIHAAAASPSSFAQFLLEQIVTGAPLMQNRSTVEELFSGGLPRSQHISLYEAYIRIRSGDLEAARRALRQSDEIGAEEVVAPYVGMLRQRIVAMINR